MKYTNEQTYFSTYSAAVGYAREKTEAKGFEIFEQDWFSEVNVGQGRPGSGKISVSNIGLIKNGKTVRKLLHIQVYNTGTNGNCFELNFYIS